MFSAASAPAVPPLFRLRTLKRLPRALAGGSPGGYTSFIVLIILVLVTFGTVLPYLHSEQQFFEDVFEEARAAFRRQQMRPAVQLSDATSGFFEVPDVVGQQRVRQLLSIEESGSGESRAVLEGGGDLGQGEQQQQQQQQQQQEEEEEEESGVVLGMVVSSTVDSMSSDHVSVESAVTNEYIGSPLFVDSPEIQRELHSVEQRSGIPWASLPATWWGDSASWPEYRGATLLLEPGESTPWPRLEANNSEVLEGGVPVLGVPEGDLDGRDNNESGNNGSDSSESDNDEFSGVPASRPRRRRRYLFFSLRNEVCAGVAHTRTSLACQLAVARALNRTLLVDASKCMAPEHMAVDASRFAAPERSVDGTSVAVDASTITAHEHSVDGTRGHVQPLFAYFDLARVSLAPVVPLQRFVAESARWGVRNGGGAQWGEGEQGEQMEGEKGEKGERTEKEGRGGQEEGQAERLTAAIAPESAGLEDLVRLSEPALLVRQAATGFADCEDPRSRGVVSSDWSAIEYRPELWAVAEQIIASMDGGDYDAVHVRRGDKARDASRWPNLARDTSVQVLAQKLPSLIPPGRALYIASDESSSFFDPLRAIQGGPYRVHMLGDFAHLWGEGGEWWRAQLALMEGHGEVAFDAYMEAIVDYAVFAAARKRVETFNDLTSDPRNGMM
ncbi:hypothetical protein CLOM_g248 [Closterium sp. NIES-68]|nr:hypothetical protein CLOM_g248 [Closterium sp. NIES-68]GJP86339.1 hypothetical protein CLOP_g16371 [Closterium sp. NIES-67]